MSSGDGVIDKAKTKMKKSLAALNEEFKAIRTGRSSTVLFEQIKVDYYGNKTPLNQMATLSSPEARLVVIQPWDTGALAEVEKSIRKSDLSVNPNNDGKVIRVNIPPLTEERRKDLAKTARNLAEQSRVAIRNIRREANDELKKNRKDGTLSENEEKRHHDEIQKLTDSNVEHINKLIESKEKEIMEE